MSAGATRTRRARRLQRAALAALCLLAGCGPCGKDQEQPVVPGLEPIGAGAAADPAVADDLKASTDPSVHQPFAGLEPVGKVFRIDASRQPGRPVRVALPLERQLEDGELPLVASASSPSGPWQPVRARAAGDGHAVVFDAPHFSWFTPLVADVQDLLDEATRQFDGLTSGATAEAEPPRCQDESGAREGGWSVKSHGPDTVKWCFGREKGRHVVRVVNSRRYPLLVAHPGAEVIEPPDLGVAAKAAAKVSPRRTVLPPRGAVTYSVEADATVRTEFDGVADSLYQLQFASDLALEFMTRFGVDEAKGRLKLARLFVDSAKCLDALRSHNGGELIAGCFGDTKQLGDALGLKGVLLGALMTSSSVVEFFHSKFNALGDQLNGRDRYVLHIAYDNPPVLGGADILPNGEGWGTVAPTKIYNGGVPNGLASDIEWSDWGAPTAYGKGMTSIYRPEGGYYSQSVPIEFRATRLGTCPGSGQPAYTRLLARVPKKPGGPFEPWFPWMLDLCDYDAEAPGCGDVALAPNSDDGVFEIKAWDVGCSEAKQLAKAVSEIGVKPGESDEYDTNEMGFSCTGYSSDADELPQISWTCTRGTAQVTFNRG